MPVDKHRRFFKTETIIFLCVAKHTQINQNNKFVNSLNSSRKKLVMKLIFSMHINIKVSVIWLQHLDHESLKWWYYHFWWAWSSILKLLKVTSLQYLYNISNEKLWMEFTFCMQINIKVSTSLHIRFWCK